MSSACAASLRANALKRLQSWLASKPNLPIKPISEVGTQAATGWTTCYDPATGKPLNQFRATSSSDLDIIVRKAKHAQKIWADIPPLERSKILYKLADMLRAESEWLTELEVLDTGKPFWEAAADVNACADTITMFAGYAPSMTGSHVAVPPNPASFYYTRREPFGVCCGIGAWNFPLQMAIWKSAPAIAAGNSFVFKPSPMTVLSAAALKDLYDRSGCPEDLFSVVYGGSGVGQALVAHPLISKISFTGSVGGGQAVLSAAGGRVLPCTAELGGKSALIIMPDACLEDAVKGTLMANFYTQGEVCSNAARVFVHQSIFEQFKSLLVSAVKALRVGDPFDPCTASGALISTQHVTTVKKYIQSAIDEGAHVLIGGESPTFPKDSDLDSKNFLTPCVLIDCHDDMLAVQEEIFGPVVTLLSFNDEDEVVRRVNNSDLGLAGGLFTKDLNSAHRIAARLECGSVYVNSYNQYPPGVPFGGYKHSGYGRENCLDTLNSYTQIKSVIVEGGPLPAPFPE